MSEAPRSSEHGGVLLRIAHSQALADELEIGASLAVSGVCLTVIEMTPGETAVELSPETLSRTTLGDLERGSRVNLEPALKVGDPLGGHWVQGHVDTTTEVDGRRDLDDHREVSFLVPPPLAAYLVEKGSVTIDGVSLTVASHDERSFTVALIPHTLDVTTLAELGVGDRVNVEVDVLAKYVYRALQASGVVPGGEG